MADYIISTTSTADLPKEYVQKNDVVVLPYSFIIGETEYLDDFGASMPIKTFYNKVRDGALPTTSMVNQNIYRDFFTPLLEQGKDVLFLEFSSGLSGSYQNAEAVIQELNAKYPNKIYFCDTLCASLGQGLLVDYIVKMRRDGKSIEEAHTWAEEHKRNMIHWFTVDDLNHLRRGGRVSAVSAFLGTMLNIKPVLDVDDAGHLIPIEKVRGRKKALKMLVKMMKSDIENPDGQTVFISHGDAPEDAQYVEKKVREAFPTITDIMIHTIGPVIGAHSGPGTVALFYFGKKRY